MQTTTKIKMSLVAFYSHSTACLALFCIVIMPVGALGSTRGHAVVQ